MCAINGCNFEDKELILRMNRKNAHRGPDGSGVFLSEGVSLGHNRLKIIDLSEAASQPMKTKDERCIVVFNGEIYNFRELRKELEGEFHFQSVSDTEVILASYAKWGNECLSHFSGMFAFAIWDKKEKKIFAARDHTGIKPFYYFWDGEKFFFSSEIKSILEGGVPRILNVEAMNLYFSLLYVPSPLTLFEGILKLPPGNFLELSGKKFRVEKYFEGRARPEKLSLVESAQRVRESLEMAVEAELVSDRPVGVYLSGGLDSNAVLSAVRKASNHAPKTFSLGFEVDTPQMEEKFNADFRLARESSKYFQTDHREVIFKKEEVVSLFQKFIFHIDEPVAIPTGLSMLKLGGEAKKEVAVVLGGNGGDELFGGYERYHLSYIASLYQKFVPGFLRKQAERNTKLKKLNTPAGVDRFLLFMEHEKATLKGFIHPEYCLPDTTRNFFLPKFSSWQKAEKGKSNIPFELEFMDVDRETWVPDESLTLADKMSMASGLELRVPMLNQRVIQTALTIPLSQKVSFFDKKIVLKEAFLGHIPNFLFKEPKRGWFSPGSFWLRTLGMKSFARDVFQNPPEGAEELFDMKKAREMLEDHLEHRKYYLNSIWPLLSFLAWMKEYKIELPQR